MTPPEGDLGGALRERALLVLLSLTLIAVLRPHPAPDPLRRPLRAGAEQLQSGDSAAALASLEDALAFAPELAQVRATAAELALQAGEPERALHHLGRLMPAAPVAVDQVCLATEARLALADPEQAIGVLEEAPGHCSLPLTRLAELTQEAFQQGEVERARRFAQAWARLAPESPQAALELAIATALLEPSAAAGPLQRALELTEPPSRLARELQLALELAGSDPSQPYVYAQVGQALARAGRWMEARQALRAAVELEPEYIEARAYYGLALDRSGADGLEMLERAYRESDRAALPASFLGLHWLEAGDPEQALPYLERATEVNPQNPAYAAQLGAAYAARGDLQSARAQYETALQLADDQAHFYRLAADFSLRHEVDPTGLGIPAARRAYLLDPGAASADLLGYAHLLAGQFEPAERMLERAVQLDLNSPSARYHLALLRLEQDRPDEAVPLLESVVELDPEGAYGELAARTLQGLRP